MHGTWLCSWANRHQYGETCNCEEKANLAFLEWSDNNRRALQFTSARVTCKECRRVFGGVGITDEQRDSDILYHKCRESGREGGVDEVW